MLVSGRANLSNIQNENALHWLEEAVACPVQISKLCTSQNKPSQLGRKGFGHSLTYLVVPVLPSNHLSVWHSLWCQHLLMTTSAEGPLMRCGTPWSAGQRGLA